MRTRKFSEKTLDTLTPHALSLKYTNREALEDIMETINSLIEEAEQSLEDDREHYAWYAPEIARQEERLVILKEVQAAMIENGEE